MNASTLRPLTMAEISWRRRSIVFAAYGYPYGRSADMLGAQLERDIAERGCEPITDASRTIQTEAGRILFLIDGGRTEPPQPRLRLCPRSPDDDGGRAA